MCVQVFGKKRIRYGILDKGRHSNILTYTKKHLPWWRGTHHERVFIANSIFPDTVRTAVAFKKNKNVVKYAAYFAPLSSLVIKPVS